MRRKNGFLYSVLIIAGVAVMIFSVLGMVVMNELLPRAERPNVVGTTSDKAPLGKAATGEPDAQRTGKATPTNGTHQK
jgi:hypothetical protein